VTCTASHYRTPSPQPNTIPMDAATTLQTASADSRQVTAVLSRGQLSMHADARLYRLRLSWHGLGPVEDCVIGESFV